MRTLTLSSRRIGVRRPRYRGQYPPILRARRSMPKGPSQPRRSKQMPAPSHVVSLDHNATTPLDPRVFEAMRPFFTDGFGNAASITHVLGRAAAQAVEVARSQVATLLHADPKE